MSFFGCFFEVVPLKINPELETYITEFKGKHTVGKAYF